MQLADYPLLFYELILRLSVYKNKVMIIKEDQVGKDYCAEMWWKYDGGTS